MMAQHAQHQRTPKASISRLAAAFDKPATFRHFGAPMNDTETISQLKEGTLLLFGGDQAVPVSAELAAKFRPGDQLRVVEQSGTLLHIPAAEAAVAKAAVGRAQDAFHQMGAVSDAQISAFYEGFAARLEDEEVWREIQSVNDQDVADAKRRGRSTTRLEAGPELRKSVIDGLRGWIDTPSKRGQVLEQVEHDGWSAQLVGAELGTIGFIFEGRPNVVADATGVLRGGNTVVFRIGRDALGTAKAMMALALVPALQAAGLPEGAVVVVDSAAHAAGWALFSDRRLSLAVARGSGPAVATLGGLAQQAGVPVSLHGTGGAWITAAPDAEASALAAAVSNSLDRKVCNTLNTLCITKDAAAKHVPAALRGLQEAAQRRGQSFKLHVAAGSEAHVPAELFDKKVKIQRAEGDVEEKQAQPIGSDQLGVEWEWEGSPEITLVVVPNVQVAAELFNAQSPQFVACLISPSRSAHDSFYSQVNAPFVGDAFTRWVDGQFALNKPELGLSNWANGRLFGRGGVLSGDSVFTVRTRYVSK